MAIIVGTANPDIVDLTTDPAQFLGLEDDRIAGLGGNDEIFTSAGNDFIDGGADHDRLSAGDGNDIVVCGSGNDTVLADAGNDVYYGGDGLDWLSFAFIHVGAGFVSQGNVSPMRIDLASTGVQNLGEFGLDQFFGFENVSGGFGADTILGTSGANSFVGESGNDTLDGRGGNDTLRGDWGADILIGGPGADLLTTRWQFDDGARDLIRFRSLLDSGVTAATRDQVFGFARGSDKIDLSLIDANPSLAGNQAFRVVAAFTSAPGEVRLDRAGADTIVQVDGDTDTAVDMTVRVVGVHLTASDFLL
jgi:Ca2+-binding RTX toxin-like protein